MPEGVFGNGAAVCEREGERGWFVIFAYRAWRELKKKEKLVKLLLRRYLFLV